MLIEFDPAKDALNRKKHGVSLGLAEAFDWEHVLTYPARTVSGEVRYFVLGQVGLSVYSAVVTMREGTARIISLRLANRRERIRHAEVEDWRP